ncbi:septal ring lytic transglycosylase RlpA family protein [Granulicella arctica]|uniref:Probable endolytic peptidoglycan transglycosylase RlpA n=1 Tax=Granulicella arctica TaxID=940613 RepID=A0A7Y9TJJ1_9BACT|nr:septal ring lytic transglycosylase RlpA family protein [Granulicella arctica]NYF78327.1 rare lipoprotein A [Granulicella arctica]
MIFTNEVRLASCSVVALLMMSIPGLGHQPFEGNAQPSFDTPTATPASFQPAVVNAPVVDAPAKKKLSLFRRANVGLASWYGAVLNGHKTASGETFDMNQMTACHRTLPFGTIVRVVDLNSGKSVVVRINDRGVLFKERIIDLSRGAADMLGIRRAGVANVRLEVLPKKQGSEAIANEIAAAKAPEAPAAQSVALDEDK